MDWKQYNPQFMSQYILRDDEPFISMKKREHCIHHLSTLTDTQKWGIENKLQVVGVIDKMVTHIAPLLENEKDEFYNVNDYSGEYIDDVITRFWD
jgi:hypothetical protein